MPRQAAILCGGLGTRLGLLTAATPKPLLEVGGRPFLEILIEEIVRQGVTRVLLLAGFAAETIGRFATDLPQRLELDFTIEVAIEPHRAGTGGALFHTRDLLDDVFFLMNGDSWFDVPILPLAVRLTTDDELIGVLSLRRLADTDRYGVVETNGERIMAFTPAEPGRRGVINAGVYAFRKTLIERLSETCSLESDILPTLAAGGRLGGVEAEGYFLDIGIPADFERAQTEIPARRIRPAVFFDRDGVLNVDHGHVGTQARFEWMAGAREAIASVNRAGFYAFVVTNQAGIGKGFYSEDDYIALRRHMRDQLRDACAHIDDERYCPDHPCAAIESHRRASDWRKPGPGMLLDLMRRWPVDKTRSFLVGDKDSDIDAANAAGLTGHLFVHGDLNAFIKPLLDEHGRS